MESEEAKWRRYLCEVILAVGMAEGIDFRNQWDLKDEEKDEILREVEKYEAQIEER